jgi:hypothetical protein
MRTKTWNGDGGRNESSVMGWTREEEDSASSKRVLDTV